MHTRSTLAALAAAAGTAMASTSSSSSSASTITTTFFNLGPGITPVASIIAVNATDPALVTYLIHCPPAFPAITTTSTPASFPPGWATANVADPENDPWSTQPLYQSSTCLIPADGMTLVAGPTTMRLEHTNTHSPLDMTKTYDCTLTETLDAVTLSATEGAPRATKTVPAYAFAHCDTYLLGMNLTLNVEAGYPYLKEMSPLVVTAGVEKLAAARSAGKAGASATAAGKEAAATSASASSAESRSAAVGRLDLSMSVGVAGAAGLLLVTLML